MNNARSMIIVVRRTKGAPNIGIPGITWLREASNVFHCYHPDRSGDYAAFKQIAVDGDKVVYAVACTHGFVAKLSQVRDAHLTKDWYSDRTLLGRRARALSFGVKENTDKNGFEAPHTLSGMDPIVAGRDYPGNK